MAIELLEPLHTRVSLRVFDVGGRQIARRVIEAGATNATVHDLAPGVYFVRAVLAGRPVSARAVAVR